MSELVPVHPAPAPDVRPRWIQALAPRTRRGRRRRRENLMIAIGVAGIAAGVSGFGVLAWCAWGIMFTDALLTRSTP